MALGDRPASADYERRVVDGPMARRSPSEAPHDVPAVVRRPTTRTTPPESHSPALKVARHYTHYQSA